VFCDSGIEPGDKIRIAGAKKTFPNFSKLASHTCWVGHHPGRHIGRVLEADELLAD
jgi:hypothetical protein